MLMVPHRAAPLHVLLETFPEAATHLSVGCSTPAELSLHPWALHICSHTLSHIISKKYKRDSTKTL